MVATWETYLTFVQHMFIIYLLVTQCNAPSVYSHPYVPHVVPALGYVTMPQFGPATVYAYATLTPAMLMPQGQPPLI